MASDIEHTTNTSGNGPSTVFVGGLPSDVIGLRKLLKDALAAYEIKSCRIAVSCFNRTRSFAHLTLKSHAAAEKLIREQDGVLRLPGTPSTHPALRFSMNQGKTDMLFPLIPASLRAKIRLDPTAHFSVSNQESSQRVTQLILCLIAVGQRDPNSKLINTLDVRTSKNASALDAVAVVKAVMEKENLSAKETSTSQTEDRMEDSMERTAALEDEEMPDASAASSGGVVSAYSPDESINAIIRSIAEANWSLWGELFDPPILSSAPVLCSPYTITDACACAGGNTLDFGRHFARTNAIELDFTRCADLRANVDLLRLNNRVNVIQGDANLELPKFFQHIVYADPPWGGAAYKEIAATNGADLYLGETALKDWCWTIYERSLTRLIVLRVPMEYDHTAIAKHMVRIPAAFELLSKERNIVLAPLSVPRPHPFRVQLEKVVLLVFALPSKEELEEAKEKIFGPVAATSASAPSTASASCATVDPLPPLHFTLCNLDSLIYVLNGYNVLHSFEADPAFFDFEKTRWISTRRWKGCTLQPAKVTHNGEKQAALEREIHNKPAPGEASGRDKRNMKRRREKQEAKKEEKRKRKDQKLENSSENETKQDSSATDSALSSSHTAAASVSSTDTDNPIVEITGGCHCKGVRFICHIPRIQTILDCNCSICSATGFLHLVVPHGDFKLLTPEENITTYRFGTMKAGHMFCKICGIKSFYQPRSHPDSWSVNLNCVDDRSLLHVSIEKFDGRGGWEKAAEAMTVQ